MLPTRFRAILLTLISMLILATCATQLPNVESSPWARATLKKLTLRQKIAQMMVYHMNLDYMPADSPKWMEIETLIETDGIGSIHVWTGDAQAAKTILNQMQSMSRVPIMVQADLEYGIKGRFDAGTEIPRPMALSATGKPELAFEAGRITAQEGRAIGLHLALAPVVDVNNNPDNPIINTRSFGDDPDQVSLYAEQFMLGLQAGGMLATAKHFPGHGDTQTDSHSALAKIPEDPTRLYNIELKPFQHLIDGGVDLIMVGHLDAGEFQMESGVPSSLSPYLLYDVLRRRMGFQGTIITDAMAMKAISNEYSKRYALIHTIKAGADLIIQDYDYKGSIDAVEEAVKDGLLTEERINESVLRILTLKSKLGLDRKRISSQADLQQNLGTQTNIENAQLIMRSAITLVRDSLSLLPLKKEPGDTLFVIDVLDRPFDHKPSQVTQSVSKMVSNVLSYAVDSSDPATYYSDVLSNIPDSSQIIVNVFSRIKMRKGRVQLPEIQADFIQTLARRTPFLIVTSFGSPYLIRDFPEVDTYLCTYSAQESMQTELAQALVGKIAIRGKLPVSIPGIATKGTGLQRSIGWHTNLKQTTRRGFTKPQLLHVAPEDIGSDPGMVMPHIRQAMKEYAWPGGVLLAGKDGQIFLDEYFGNHVYDGERRTYLGDVFDLASVTKVIATTSAAMKLFEEGKLQLDSTVVSYLPEFVGPDSLNTVLKATITVKNLMTHTAGMRPFKRFYAMDAPSDSARLDSVFEAELDTLPGTKFMYSDIGLITLGKILEKLAGTDLKSYTDSVIFKPLRMDHTTYLPTELLDRIVPTEISELDSSLIQGYVHDENSHSLGGITGHAGLFSTAHDLARFSQMMLNGGTLEGIQIFTPETIALFTQRAHMLEDDEDNSRCLGWDSPSETSSGGVYLSPNSFGHTGFTGTSLWIDPDNQMFVILLTNAVHPHRSYKYPNYFDWRQRVHSGVYESLGFTEISEGLEWRERWLEEQAYHKTLRYKIKRFFNRSK